MSKRQTHRPISKAFQHAKMRKLMREECYRQLNGLLETQTELPRLPSDPPDVKRIGSMLDDLCLRALHGYGVNVSISVRHPNELGRAAEDPSITEAEPPTDEPAKPSLIVMP